MKRTKQFMLRRAPNSRSLLGPKGDMGVSPETATWITFSNVHRFVFRHAMLFIHSSDNIRWLQ